MGVALALGAGTLVTTPVQARDVGLWVALVGAGAVCIEATRHAGQPAGRSKDLLSAWKIPVALLLPPVFAILSPIPLTALKQARVRPGLLHRRVLSAAAIGVADCTGSLLFHRLVPATTSPAGWFVTAPSRALAVAVLCGAVCTGLNLLLIAVATKLASYEVRWGSALGNRETFTLDVGETCAGVLVTGACALSAFAVLIAIPPILLLHRSLNQSQLRAAARTDPKTGLLNAAAWQEEAEREIVRATRERRPLALLIADLDHFKGVNDRYGHLVGDQMLAVVAGALQTGLRPYDFLGRFGGEEFTVVLPNADAVEAVRIAERLRADVAAALLALDAGGTVQSTVSIGLAELGTHGSDLTDLLAAADVALYRAKAEGRNRVTAALG